MNSVKLVLSKLLGFKILPAVAASERAESKANRKKSSKIGSKVGRKVPPDTVTADI